MINMKYFIIMLLALVVTINCRDPKVIKKIHPKLRLEINNLKDANQIDKRIIILFKVNENLTDLHHKILKREKLKINANIGNIYTATISAKNVYNVARLRWVEYVQGQKKMITNPPNRKPSRIKEK